MNNVERALSCFKDGFSCSQAVASALAPKFGLDQETALKVAGAFGGGMARMGMTCGAVTGAFIVIGLKHAKLKKEDEAAKDRTYKMTREFVEKFKTLNKSITCKELLNCDLNTPEGLKFAKDNNLWSNVCPKFIKDAVEIIEQIL